MGLFGSLYVGSSGLQTSQNALNTTAHNMSNVDTKGYTRQQILLGTRTYNTLSVSGSAIAKQQVGLGVYYSQTRQVRDMFMDKLYRKESGRSSFYETSSAVIQEVEDLFGEFQGVEFSKALENLWVSVQELSKDPGKLTNQNLFVNRASEFVERAGLVYDGLSQQQDNLNKTILKDVDKINGYGEQLVDLNKKILKIEAGGMERANDLRDRRNMILDELSKMGNINYMEEPNGIVTVQFEGVNFVSDDSYHKMDVHQDKNTGFYTPYWSQLARKTTYPNGETELDLNACRVYDPTQRISFEQGTDVGSLRAKLLNRGEKRATYQDMQDPDYYNNNIAQSTLMNMQAEFDQLVNKVVTAINDVMAKAAASEPDTDYMKDKDGNPLQLFLLKTNDPNEGFTTRNILINAEIKRDPSVMDFRLKDGSEDRASLDQLVSAFSDEKYTLNPNLETKTSLVQYYNALISQVSENGEIFRNISEAQQLTVNEASTAREMVAGVSADEEMEFMIKFQNAYNASSRYINVISEMMEHIIMTMGR